MSPRKQPETTAPVARLEFAKRLRELRIPRGFRTARSLARSLEIDENRYTRYERAEVEPDLAMIRRICATLTITPNDLLGVPETEGAGRSSRQRQSKPPPIGANGHGSFGLATAAWRLAEAATEVRRSVASGTALETPLAAMNQTSALYKTLMSQPFEAISELLADPGLSHASATQVALLRERIDRLVELLK